MRLNHLALLISALALAACAQDAGGVRVTNAVPAPDPVAAPPSKVEPIFYNGKTYKVAMSTNPDGTVAMRIPGMGKDQQKDATGLATSALHHYNCKDSQKIELAAQPAFDGTGWFAAGRCA